MKALALRNPWNQRNPDDIVQMAREKKARKILRDRLASCHAVVDSNPPSTTNMKHLTTRLKKQQMLADRNLMIANENRKLMEKMANIMKRDEKKKEKLYTYVPQSLNETERKLEIERINFENRLILERLQGQEPVISHKQMQEDYKIAVERRQHMSRAYKRMKRAKKYQAEMQRRMQSSQSALPSINSKMDQSDQGFADILNENTSGATQLKTANQIRQDVANHRGNLSDSQSTVEHPISMRSMISTGPNRDGSTIRMDHKGSS